MAPGTADAGATRGEARAERAAAGPPLRWEEAGGRSLTATACTVASARDEIALLFGTTEADDPESSELCVRWSTRIILRPSVAAGLASTLRATLQRHEVEHGPLGQPTPPGVAHPSPLLLLPTSDAKSAAARLLLGLVRGLRTPFGFERSFKLSRNVLLGNRFLTTVNKEAGGGLTSERLTAICTDLRMPDRLLQLFRERLPAATFVHFGFEETESSALYKVYLEFWTNWDDELSRRAAKAEPFLLHLGLKWDTSDPGRAAVTRYTCHPWLSVDEVRRRLGEIYATKGAVPPLQAVRAILDTASGRTRPGRMLYLEVSEDGNPRRSFDLNFYKAGLRLQVLDEWMSQLGAHYAVPAERFRRVYDFARPRALGHIAGGLDREGHDFLTIYYGMEGF